ncbi:Nucleolar protein 10, partial [Quaeritorhiza haematococci]
MVLEVTNPNNVKVYHITSSSRSALPDWLAKKKYKSLREDPEWSRRIELIQDFEFPEASMRLRATKDGKYIVGTGVYKPQMRVWELADLALKFERHTDAENVQFQFGRDISYHYPTCDLLVTGASNEVWRLNLEQGRFLNSLPTSMSGVNVCDINPAHQLWGFGGEDGRLEFWHPYNRTKVGSLDVRAALPISPATSSAPLEITSLKFADDGLTFAVGTSTGHVLLYDLRRAAPLIVKDHQYGFPIKSVQFHTGAIGTKASEGPGGTKIVSADTKIVKIWDKDDGKIFTSVEPPNDINDVLLQQGTGLMMLASEGQHIPCYYIPSLGPAPRWCPFLDNLTEELEENPMQTIYDDYKFVTRKELNNLGLDHLVGTNLLRAYMHGFFVDLRLYEKAKAIANPFDYEEFKRRQVQARIDKQRATRISAIKKLPKVNRNLAAKILTEQLAQQEEEEEKTATEARKKKSGIAAKEDWKKIEDEVDSSDDERDVDRTKARKKKSGSAGVGSMLEDNRFAAMFADPDFEIDVQSHEYRLRNPTLSKTAPTNEAAAFDDDDEESDDDSANGSSEDEDANDDIPTTSPGKTTATRKKPGFYELKDGLSISDSFNPNSKRTSSSMNFQKSKRRSFAERVQSDEVENARGGGRITKSRSGNLSMTFVPKGRGGGGGKRGR